MFFLKYFPLWSHWFTLLTSPRAHNWTMWEDSIIFNRKFLQLIFRIYISSSQASHGKLGRFRNFFSRDGFKSFFFPASSKFSNRPTPHFQIAIQLAFCSFETRGRYLFASYRVSYFAQILQKISELCNYISIVIWVYIHNQRPKTQK